MTQPNPVPQVGPDTGNPTPPAPTTPPTPAVPAAPPWGEDANFDASRAWSRIQNMQADNEKLKARNAELAGFEQRVREMEDAQKTELQRAQEAAAAAQKTAAEAQLALLRHRVANRPDRQLPAVLVDVLRGSTEEELIAHADQLLAGITPTAPPTAPVGTTPVSALRPTTLPNPPAPDINAQIAEARAKGDLMTVIALENSKLANLPKR